MRKVIPLILLLFISGIVPTLGMEPFIQIPHVQAETDTFTVNQGSDDCVLKRTPEWFSTSYSEMLFGDSDSSNYDYEGGMRWEVDIPQGAIIDSAYLKMVSATAPTNIATMIIFGEDADDPLGFSSAVNYKNRVRTSESVEWTPAEWTGGVEYTSPDISSIIQEIVDREGFGTHIVLFMVHEIGWGGVSNLMRGAPFEHATYDPPKLEVTWTPPTPVEGDYIDSWATSVQTTLPRGITTDGSNIWVLDETDDEVYKYTMAGVYVDSWDTGLADNSRGITTDGSNIYIIDYIDDEVYKHTMTGVYVDSWDTSVEAAGAYGIATDGTNIWLVDFSTYEIYKYFMNGTYTTEHWDTSIYPGCTAITTDGTNIWLISYSTEEFHKFTMAGGYLGSWDTSGEGLDAHGIATDGVNIWILDSTDEEVHKYEGPEPGIDSGSWQISQSSDDCIRYNGTFSIVNSITPYWTHTTMTFQNGMRWNNVTIPKGATIELAYIRWTAYVTDVKPSAPYVTIKGEDEDNSVTFSTLENFDLRTRTEASAEYDIPAVTIDFWYSTNDLKTIIQEIIEREGWVSGNNLTLFTGPKSPTDTTTRGNSWDSTPVKAPILVVTWTPPAPVEGDYIDSWGASDASGSHVSGMGTDGNFIWISNYGEDEVYKFNMDGTYTGQHWNTLAQGGAVYGVCSDGSNIWTVDYLSDKLNKYTMAGVYVSQVSIIGQSGDSKGVATDGNFIWIVDSVDRKVYKYTMAGVYTTEWFSIAGGGDNSHGITTDGENIWIIDISDLEVYKYTMAGVYVSSWDHSVEAGQCYGIATDGTYIWILQVSPKMVYKYWGPPAPEGEEYYRYISTAISWAGSAYRLCAFNRVPSQSMSLSTDSYRTWNISRSLSQGLTFASNAFVSLAKIIERAVSLALSLSSDAFREWNLLRTASQSLCTSFNGYGWKLVSRLATQSISFTANAMGELIAAIRRTVSLSISFTTNAFGEWKKVFWILLDIAVKTLTGDPIENAAISAWALNGTARFAEYTNYTGYIQARNLTKGYYTIMASKEGYLTNNTIFLLLQDKVLEISLMSAEEGVNLNLEILVLFIGTVFWTLLFLRSNFVSITNGVLAWMFSWGTGFYWLASNTTIPAIAWLFVAWGLVTLYLALISFLEYRKVVASR